MLSFGEANQFHTLKNRIIRGVEVKKLGPKVLRSLREAWELVAREKSSNNKDFRRVLKSIKNYKKDYSIWSELAGVSNK